MIVEAIRNFITTCPYLSSVDGVVKINVNYLGTESTVYSINEEPDEIILKKYVNGDTIRQYNFTLTSKEAYGEDVVNNIKNSNFYEKFLEWLEDQTSKKNLPILGSDKKSIEIKAISNGHVLKVENDKVIYQIKCKLIYLRKGEMK